MAAYITMFRQTNSGDWTPEQSRKKPVHDPNGRWYLWGAGCAEVNGSYGNRNFGFAIHTS